MIWLIPIGRLGFYGTHTIKNAIEKVNSLAPNAKS